MKILDLGTAHQPAEAAGRAGARVARDVTVTPFDRFSDALREQTDAEQLAGEIIGRIRGLREETSGQAALIRRLQGELEAARAATRHLEEKLRQSQRMEAVGRLASEVATTCDSLLRVGEVTRAASFLRQLVVYGDKQTRALGPVEMTSVLRELVPVLRRLAGEDIDIVVPRRLPRVHVDVDGEDVERILVNVAAYARERMSPGGRITIDLSIVALDREFVARHPSVRPGPHVLMAVTGVRCAQRSYRWVSIRGKSSRANEATSPAERPGVDLGALQSLVGNSGGHLWMAAEPEGDMVLNVYLPCGF